MKKITLIKKICLPLSILLLFSSCTIKQTNPIIRTVTVSGSGQVDLKNDTAIIELSVETKNPDLLTAIEENENHLNDVWKALNDKGINSDNINAEGYTIGFEEAHQNGRFYIQAQYVITRHLKVATGSLNRCGEIIDAAFKSGANSLVSLTYKVSDSSKEDAVKQARLLASKQAEETAQILASSNALMVGQLINIEETSSADYPRRQLDSASTNDVNSIIITVNATYELK